MERIEPIRPDRTVQPVELPRLTPVEREQEKQRRERERRRRTHPRPQDPPTDGRGGVDIRV
jgi:hypothetical protein